MEGRARRQAHGQCPGESAHRLAPARLASAPVEDAIMLLGQREEAAERPAGAAADLGNQVVVSATVEEQEIADRREYVDGAARRENRSGLLWAAEVTDDAVADARTIGAEILQRPAFFGQLDGQIEAHDCG